MFDKELTVARRLALEAGQLALRYYQSGVAVEYKSPQGEDPVTQADRDANRLIVEGLRAAFPDDGILAEESPLSAQRLSRERLWCVDPIDGTQEFIAHNGEFVVMIGLAVAGRAQLGVVYQPTTNTLCFGYGKEAYSEHDGEITKLHVDRETRAGSAVMMVSRSHRSETVSRVAQTLGVLREQPMGSVGLKVVTLARGEGHIYLSFSTHTHEWDTCAPEAILTGAGGLLTDTRGEPLSYNKEEPNTPFGVLATNRTLHPMCLEAVAPVLSERRMLSQDSGLPDLKKLTD